VVATENRFEANLWVTYVCGAVMTICFGLLLFSAVYTQVGHKLRFSLVLINDSCVVQIRNSTLLRTFTPCSP